MSTHPAGSRVSAAVAAAVAELGAAAGILGVVVDPPAPPDDAEPWAAHWRVRVTVHHRGGSTADHLVAPATGWAELLVHLAGWLQDDLADAGVSQPCPPCPGHGHPMRAAVRDGRAWWGCPLGDPVRRFAGSADPPA